MKTIILYTVGDSSKLSTWSNVPALFLSALRKNQFRVIPVNIEPLPWLNRLFNRISFALFQIIFKSKAAQLIVGVFCIIF